MRLIGLTGSMAMGKSTVAGLFARLGIPVHSSDGAVHALYRGDAAPLIEKEFPGTVTDGRVDRNRLAEMIAGDPPALARLESLVHPLVEIHRAAFVHRMAEAGHRFILLDIPLLFETGQVKTLDTILVVTAPPEVQEARILERAGMTRQKMTALLSRQMPDEQKRARAHFLIDTSRPVPDTGRQVAAIRRALMFTR